MQTELLPLASSLNNANTTHPQAHVQTNPSRIGPRTHTHRFQNSASALLTRATHSLSRGSSTSSASRSSVALSPATSSWLRPLDADSSSERMGSRRWASTLQDTRAQPRAHPGGWQMKSVGRCPAQSGSKALILILQLYERVALLLNYQTPTQPKKSKPTYLSLIASSCTTSP